MKISSTAFENNSSIPAKYTCDGMDITPPLKFETVPASAKSLALIVDDPDAPHGTWVHWVVWNIDPETAEIKEDSVPSGASQVLTAFKRNDYGGPCPPSGTHRYFFKLYAIDTKLAIKPSSSKADLEGAMKGHIIETAEIVGIYRRK